MSWDYRSIQNIDIRSHIENYVANTMHTLQLRMSTISNQLFESKKFFEKTLGKHSENMVYQDNLNYLSCFTKLVNQIRSLEMLSPLDVLEKEGKFISGPTVATLNINCEVVFLKLMENRLIERLFEAGKSEEAWEKMAIAQSIIVLKNFFALTRSKKYEVKKSIIN